MERPYIICLMMTSMDGKILGHSWGDDPHVKRLLDKFEETHEKIGIRAWIVGRTTMEKDFTHFAKPVYKEVSEKISREDHIAGREAKSFAIAIDSNAKLGWEKPTMQGDHVISVLTEGVPDSYLAHLKDIGVSYIFAGKTKVDLHITVQKLRSLFGIEKLMLEGGGHINGSFLDEGLVDQVEQLLLPLVDGTAGATTFFDMDKTEKKKGVTLFNLQEVKQIEDDVLWITYKVRR